MEMRQKHHLQAILLAVFIMFFPSACANMDQLSKTAKGTIAGATTGAIAGGLATGDMRGVVVGALIGGFVGNRIGAYLDEKDQEKLRQLQLKALQSGKEQSFRSNKSGQTVSITPSAAKNEVVETYELPEGVTEYDLLPADEITITAYVDTPVYAESNSRKAPRRILKQGESLHVPVRVAGKPGWGAVVDKGLLGGGLVTGYVPFSYLNPKTAKAYKAPAPKVKVAKKKPAATVAKASEVTPRQPAPATITPAVSPATEKPVKKVNASAKCKITRVKVKNIFEEQKFCEKPPPKWVAV
jgi:hypothetical protein